MTPSSDLYDLIQTLSKAEKRYFRLQASKNRRKGGHNSLQLFDEIEKMKSYEEQKLIRLFPKKQLAATKYLLYDQVMKSLRQQHENKHLSASFDHYLQEVQLLFQKGLFKQADRWLKKAKKLADKTQIEGADLRVQAWENRLLIGGKDIYGSETKFLDFSKTQEANETCQYLRTVELLGRMRMLHTCCSKRGVLCKLNEADQLMRLPIVNQEHKATSWRQQVVLLETYGLYASMKKEQAKAAAFFRQAIQILEIEERYLAHQEDYTILISSLLFCGMAESNEKHPEETSRCLSKLQSLNTEPTHWISLGIPILQFCIATSNQTFDKSEDLLNQINEQSDHMNRVPAHFRMQFECYRGILRFEQQKYDKAADAFEQVRTMEKSGAFPMIQAAARVLDTFIHLEKENFYFLEYQARALRRYLKKIQLVGRKETAWLKALGQIIHTKHHKERLQVYRRLETSIRKRAGRCLSGIPAAEQAIYRWLLAKGLDSNYSVRQHCTHNKKLLAEPGEESFSLTA